MLTLTIGELYGMPSEKDLLDTISELKRMGMTDEDIQHILDKSKDGK